MRTARLTVLAALPLAGAISCSPPPATPSQQQVKIVGEPTGCGSYESLVALFHEFLQWKDPPTVAGFADHRPEAISKRREEISQFQERLEDMAVADWERPQKVDYLTGRAHFDEQEFILNQRNEMTAAETVDYWTGMTPWLDRGVARKYA